MSNHLDDIATSMSMLTDVVFAVRIAAETGCIFGLEDGVVANR